MGCHAFACVFLFYKWGSSSKIIRSGILKHKKYQFYMHWRQWILRSTFTIFFVSLLMLNLLFWFIHLTSNSNVKVSNVIFCLNFLSIIKRTWFYSVLMAVHHYNCSHRYVQYFSGFTSENKIGMLEWKKWHKLNVWSQHDAWRSSKYVECEIVC